MTRFGTVLDAQVDIVFSLAILCMIGLGTMLNLHYGELLHKLTKEEVIITPQPRRRHSYRPHKHPSRRRLYRRSHRFQRRTNHR